MIRIENSRLGDMAKVRALHEKFYNEEFQIPSREDLIEEKVAILDGKIVGFGGIRPIYELIMILDKDRSIRSRYGIIKKLLESVEIPQVHAFVQDDHFADVLEKHFDFRSTKGKALVR